MRGVDPQGQCGETLVGRAEVEHSETSPATLSDTGLMNEYEQIRCDISNAIEADDLEAVKSILQAHPEHVRSYSWAHSAAQSGRLQILQHFISLGWGVNESKFGPDRGPPEGPLVNAVISGSFEVVKWLLDQRATSDCISVPEGGVLRNFALGTAVEDNRLDLVKLLVEYGANVNTLYANRTPLGDAVNQGHTEIAEYLRSKGAKLPSELGVGTPATRRTKK